MERFWTEDWHEEILYRRVWKKQEVLHTLLWDHWEVERAPHVIRISEGESASGWPQTDSWALSKTEWIDSLPSKAFLTSAPGDYDGQLGLGTLRLDDCPKVSTRKPHPSISCRLAKWGFGWVTASPMLFLISNTGSWVRSELDSTVLRAILWSKYCHYINLQWENRLGEAKQLIPSHKAGK